MKRAYFQYYETFEKVVQQFQTAAEQNAFRGKIIEYGLHGQEPEELSDKEAIAWVFIQDLIDDQVHRREVQAQNRAKRTAPLPAYTNGEPEEEPAPEKKTAKRTRKTAEPFTPPTVDEVDAYCRERGNGITGFEFVDYYTNVKDPAWTIGNQKKPMKDWRAAVRQWESRRRSDGKAAVMKTDQMQPGVGFSQKIK